MGWRTSRSVVGGNMEFWSCIRESYAKLRRRWFVSREFRYTARVSSKNDADTRRAAQLAVFADT